MQVDAPGTKDTPSAMESGHGMPLEGLSHVTPAGAFIKGRHSALVGTGLELGFTQHGIGRLIISGIRTERCCETTIRHACDLHWAVDFVPDATLTWNTEQLDGSLLSAAGTRTATVLTGRFATNCTVAQALDRADAPR